MILCCCGMLHSESWMELFGQQISEIYRVFPGIDSFLILYQWGSPFVAQILTMIRLVVSF